MSFSYYQELDPRVEVIVALERHYTLRDSDGESMDVSKELQRICDTYCIPDGELKKALQPMVQMEKTIVAHLPEDDTDARFLFTPWIRQTCLVWSLTRDPQDLQDLSEEVRVAKVATIAGDMAGQELTQRPKTMTELIDLLQNLDFSPKEKWDLVHLATRYSYYRQKAFEILSACATALEQQHGPLLAAMYQSGRTENEATFASSFPQLVNDGSHFAIYPCAMGFHAVRFSSSPDGKTTVWVGHLYWKIAALVQKYAAGGDQLMDRLKAIGDKSRFEILQLLKGQILSGQDISSKLSLSQGTVSHHLNTLVRNGFIQVFKKGNKIECQLDENAIDHFLLELRRALKP